MSLNQKLLCAKKTNISIINVRAEKYFTYLIMKIIIIQCLFLFKSNRQHSVELSWVEFRWCFCYYILFDVRYYTFFRIYFEWLLFNFKTFSIRGGKSKRNEKKYEMYFPIHFVIVCSVECYRKCWGKTKLHFIAQKNVCYTLASGNIWHFLHIIFVH